MDAEHFAFQRGRSTAHWTKIEENQAISKVVKLLTKCFWGKTNNQLILLKKNRQKRLSKK